MNILYWEILGSFTLVDSNKQILFQVLEIWFKLSRATTAEYIIFQRDDWGYLLTRNL